MAVMSSCLVSLTRISIPACKELIDFNIAGPLGVVFVEVGVVVAGAGVATPEEQDGSAIARVRIRPHNSAIKRIFFTAVLLTSI